MRLIAWFLSMAFFGTAAYGDVVNEDFKLVPSDGAAQDFFGQSVSISGDTAVIGAADDDDNGDSSGSAYVFRLDGSQWTQEAKLLAGDADEWDQFGSSVYIDGDTAVIGASSSSDNGYGTGSAYVFRFVDGQWIEEAKLLASDAQSGDNFGNSVSISGETAVIGARGDDDNGSNSGSAYVFRFDGKQWIEEAKFLPADGDTYDRFGSSVSIDGDTAMIGAWGNDDNGSSSGSVYVFHFDGSQWTQEAKILANDAEESDYFGSSVSIDGDTAVIGAKFSSDYGWGTGSAYVFRFVDGQWTQEAKLLAGDAAQGSERFGVSVSISGNTAVIGTSCSNDYGSCSGSAYVFRFDGKQWIEEAKLLASDGEEADQFGHSVSISGNTAVAGVAGCTDDGSCAGSAYVFELNGEDCTGDADGSGSVDIEDLLLVLGEYSTCTQNCSGDLDNDGDVDIEDMLIVIGGWGPCP